MLINIKTFNGVEINDGEDFHAALINPRLSPDANTSFVERSLADAAFSGYWSRAVATIPVAIKVAGSNLHGLTSQLKEMIKPGTVGELLVTFMDEARDYKRQCVVQSLTPVENYPRHFILILQSGESTWESAEEVTDSWEVEASGDTKTITVSGYSETKLSVELIPTELPTVGWAYQKLYELPNVLTYTLGSRPWCITMDTEALVTAGKMQSDCDDLRVVVNGRIARRWISNPNNALTKVWINLNMATGRQMTLLTPVPSSGEVGYLLFALTTNNYNAITALPTTGILKHGTEWFEYTGKIITAKSKYALTGVTRAAYGTTMQAHNAGDSFVWIQNVIHFLYGNSAVGAPSLSDSSYDDDKPIFDLAQSSNINWVYTAATGFYDPLHPTRTGGWTPTVKMVGTESKVYHKKGNAESGDAAMGMHIKTWLKYNKPAAELVTITWVLSGGVGITTVSSTGRKYRSAVTWLAAAGAKLERSNDSKAWYQVWYEITPSTATNWESWTRASAALGTTMTNVRFSFTGALPAVLELENYLEVLTCSVDFASSYLPSGSFLSEKTNYLLDVRFVNNRFDDGVQLVFPMVLNSGIDLDGEKYAVTYAGVSANNALDLNDNSRDVWIRLAAGDNELELLGDDVGSLTVNLRWKERRR